MSNPFTIRPFQPTDAEYEAIARVEGAIFPDNADTADNFRNNDARLQTGYLYQRVVVEQGGAIVAFAHYREMPWAYVPGQYQWGIYVHPDAEGQGIGTAVYDHILTVLTHRQAPPEKLLTYTRDDKPAAIHFLEKRSYQETMRWVVSLLDLAAFDPAPFASLPEKLAADDIVIVPLPELKERDSKWQQKMYDLDWELSLDEPQPTPPTRLPFQAYVDRFINDPNLIHDGWFVAVHEGDFVGTAQLYRNQTDPTQLRCGFCGTKRPLRRRGLATALKAKTIEYAQQQGYQSLRAGNEKNNPMLLLNQKLGFKPVLAQLAFELNVEE